jgi:hypothetical protein
MTCEFIVDNDGRDGERDDIEAAPSPFLTGWERVVFALADDTEELLAEELEQEMVTRYF